ncbi:hypothetical protein Vadar_032985 [Vaccinium darrowii]|uniref:Uncharacterized protein n=1 Tax=Vaccinium darrowii TaxID=229202 RepID=A0ACB7XVW6_9ERIC|nr:hypothetical protein Vadar_032985 [Vaccinium darrowii]
MGQSPSKDELLYRSACSGNVEEVKALRAQGAGLEWIDQVGRTPLIVACMHKKKYDVAKTLIELGAIVNAYCADSHAGTPLHHAAKKGLEQTVKLLLSNGANALVMNHDGRTPLDIARAERCSKVVRAIESHICLFSGWLREPFGPVFSQRLSRKVWVAVSPCGSRDLALPFKLELAVYSSQKDSQPRTLITLLKANTEGLKFIQSDHAVIISDIPNKTRIKLAPEYETDKQQLQRFCNACKGIPQVTHPNFPLNPQAQEVHSQRQFTHPNFPFNHQAQVVHSGIQVTHPNFPVYPQAQVVHSGIQVTHPNFPFNPQAQVVPSIAPSFAEDLELAMVISASLQSAMEETRPPYVVANPLPGASSSSSSQSGWATSPAPPPNGTASEYERQEAGPSGNPVQLNQSHNENLSSSLPSAPPIQNAVADGGASLSCVICLDAPVEGACVPCGHMTGCMSCLNEIKGRNWGCPVCRTQIDQVIRLYAV